MARILYSTCRAERAERNSFMEFILTVLFIFVVFGWLVKRLFPVLLTWYLKKKMKDGGGFAGGFYGAPFERSGSEDQVRRSKEQEGKVTVTTVEEKEKVIEDSMGEYIDFEEEK